MCQMQHFLVLLEIQFWRGLNILWIFSNTQLYFEYDICDGQHIPEYVFANQAGLDMLETTAASLPGLPWLKTIPENEKHAAYKDLLQALQQVDGKILHYGSSFSSMSYVVCTIVYYCSYLFSFLLLL